MQKKKIIIIDDQMHLSQGYAYNIAQRLGLKFDIMHPRSSDADIYLFLNHQEADNWLHDHARECAVILSNNHISEQAITGADWIIRKFQGTTFNHVPMILMDGFINGTAERLTSLGFPSERIVSKFKEEDIYAAVEREYEQAIASSCVSNAGPVEAPLQR